MLQIVNWILCHHQDINLNPVYDAIDLKIVGWNDNWMIELWTDANWVEYHNIDEIKEYHQNIFNTHSNSFYGINVSLESGNQRAAEANLAALRRKISQSEGRDMPTKLEQMIEVSVESDQPKEVEQKVPEKKMSPTSKKEVTNKEDKSISDISQSGVEVFRNLSHIRTERNIDLRVLKNGLGKRVFEVEGGFILAEDIVEFWLKELTKKWINLIDKNNEDEN